MSPDHAKVLARLERHRHLFDLDSGGLGAALCKAATDGVQACIAGEHAPDGTRWDDLSPAYAEWKSFQFPGNPMAVLHAVMADPREVAGELDVATRRAAVTYGVTDQARQEASWFQEGNGHQPPRPFWGFTAESLAGAEKILTARLKTL